MVSELPITAGKASDAGEVRELNEDVVASLEIGRSGDAGPAPRYAAVIADGMGGHSAGEVASRTAVDTFLDALLREAQTSAGDDPPEQRVVRAFRAANEAVYRGSRASEATSGMGTTLTGVVVSGDDLHIAHVGDTRAYLLREGAVRQLTEDDSWVAEQVERGAMTEEEARSSERRNILSQALGTRPEVPIHTYHEHLAEGDVVVLTTDGLHNSVSAAEIGDVVRAGRNVQHACEDLVRLALERDGSDNISVVCIEFGHAAGRATTSFAPRVDERPRRGQRGLALLFVLVVLAGAALVAEWLRSAFSSSQPVAASPAAVRPAPGNGDLPDTDASEQSSTGNSYAEGTETRGERGAP
jgi:serine/threonine protein phosphatase PrpC